MNERRKVVIIRNAAKTDFGGGEKVPVYIAREVAKASDLKPIILSGSDKLIEFAKNQSVECKKSWWWSRQNWSGAKALLLPIYLLWQATLYLYYIVMFIKLRPIVVNIQSKDDFIAGTLAAKTLGIRVLWSDYADLKHIFLNYTIWYKNPIGKMVYYSARFAEKIITVSEEDKRLISVHIPDGVVKDKLYTIYYGAFDSYREVSKNKTFTFISSSRIVTDKGIGELIDAFNMFQKKHSNSELHILGDGPERRRFQRIAKTNPSIKFFGHQPDPFGYISKSHVFILATYHEGFSIALVEACMLEMPIIATKVGGNPEIISNRKTGLLIPIKNAAALCEAMELFFKDKNLRDDMANNARTLYIEKFQFDKIINEKIIPLYKGLDI